MKDIIGVAIRCGMVLWVSASMGLAQEDALIEKQPIAVTNSAPKGLPPNYLTFSGDILQINASSSTLDLTVTNTLQRVKLSDKLSVLKDSSSVDLSAIKSGDKCVCLGYKLRDGTIVVRYLLTGTATNDIKAALASVSPAPIE